MGKSCLLKRFITTIGGKIFIASFLIFCSVKLFAVDEQLMFAHYTNETGLPSSYVKSITQDKYGFIWMATRLSVSRFDGKKFKEFKTFDESGIAIQLFCNQIFTSSDSILLCRTNEGKYFYFDCSSECFRPYSKLNKHLPVQSLVASTNGFWICRENQIYFLDADTDKLIPLKEKASFTNLNSESSFTGFAAKGEKMAAFTMHQQIIFLDFEKKRAERFPVPEEFKSSVIDVSYLDSYNYLWIGNEVTGLLRIDCETAKHQHFSKEKNDNLYIPHNMVHCFAEDQQNRLWIGTEAGLLLWHFRTNQMASYSYDPSNPSGLNTNPIYNAFCDRNGNVWLGTYFGGVNFWSSEKSFFRTWHSGVGAWRLGGNVVSCLTEDKEGYLWIGLEDMGLNRINPTTGDIVSYTSQKNGLSYNNLHDLLFVDRNTLWIATYTGGISILDTRTGKFSYINRKTNPNLPSDNIYALLQHGDSIFMATTFGIAVYNQITKNISLFYGETLGQRQFETISKSKNKIWFSSSSGVYYYDLKEKSLRAFDRIPEMKAINFVKSDSRGRVWIGDCYNGICYYDEKRDEVVHFNKDNNFPVSWIFSIEEGKDGWMWVSSDRGLVKFNPNTKTSVLYDSDSGIPFNQFNFRASFNDSKGNIYFGGNNGMVSFNENDNPNFKVNSNVVFTGMQLFNKPVFPGEKSPLKVSINKVDQIVLNYNQNVITIEYSALSYSTNGRCQYAYYLDNFEEEWNFVGNRDFASYTNLSPGTYYFHVKSSESNIKMALDEKVLKIVVRPPYWLSIWAFVVYFILVWAISIVLYMVGKRFEKSRALVEMERREKEHAEEINKVKLEFFTNISHELKTPLTLILGPLSKLMEEEKINPAVRKSLTIVEKNTHRLYQLINQLLEFRKIENGKERLQVASCNICTIAEEIREAFESNAEAKEVELRLKLPQKESPAWFDANKIDKIIFNLMSNAFKFTDKGGVIELMVDVVKREERSRGKSNFDLVISVSDTGKGIKPEMLDKVFDRFFQIDDNNPKHKGSGIGLAYVRSLVLLHHGKIKVESEVEKGTCFTVVIPASKNDYAKEEIVSEEVQYIEHDKELTVYEMDETEVRLIDSNGLTNDPIVLIVEDNKELIDFMKETLEEKYQVYTALNGEEAIEKLQHVSPDLIITDVMMPKMDGYEFTRRIKTDINTSHIPVIMLTAKGGIENKYKGLKTGADYYIEKPFYPHVLDQNIENILNTRKRLIERYKNDVYVPISEIAHSVSDKAFVEKLTTVIKSNLSDPDMDVTFIIREMGVSRSLLHLKLKGLVDCSTTEFIRSVRLKEAVKLISSGKCNISEAAYETGFSSPTYFTRRFKEYFGKSPRDYFNM